MAKRGGRQKILDAAAMAFAERGYHVTSLEEIAAGAGTTKSLLYYHFHSKESLYRAIVEPYFDQVERLLAQVAGKPVPLPADDAVTMIEHYLDLMRENLQVVRILLGDRPARVDTGLQEQWVSQQQRLRAVLSGDPHSPAAAAVLGSVYRPLLGLDSDALDPDTLREIIDVVARIPEELAGDEN